MVASTAANLVVEISASAKKLSTDLRSAEGEVTSFAGRAAKSLSAIGIAVGLAATAAGVTVGKMVIDAAKELDDLAESASALGIATKELQRLQFQAGQAGSSAEGVGQSLMFMQNAIQDASEGNEQLSKSFERLGLDAKSLKSLRPEEQFRKIAAAMSTITDQTEATSLSRNIFGRGGLQSLNLLRSNLEETSKLFDKLGLGASKSQEANVDAFDKSAKTVSAIWEDFKSKVAGDAIPAFTQISDSIIKIVTDMGGLQKAATSVAIGIIGAVEGIVGAFNMVSAGVKRIAGALILAQIAAAEIKAAWSNNSSEARNAPTEAEIKAMNKRREGVTNPFLPGNPPMGPFTGKSKEDFAQEATEAQQKIEDLKTSLITLNASMEKGDATPLQDSIRKLRLEMEGLNQSAIAAGNSVSGVAAKSGFGSITDERTGRTMTVGSPQGTGAVSGTGAIWDENGKVATINLNLTANQNFFDLQAEMAKDAVNKTLNVTSTIDPASNRRR
jgi:hypothetical protein